MPKVEYDDKNYMYYFDETEEEKNKRKLREQFKEKTKGKDKLQKAEMDELLLTLAKMHGLIE